MADVSVFDLEGTNLNVKDSTARNTADAASSQSIANAQDIADLKALSRLTVSYDAVSETISFTSSNHNV